MLILTGTFTAETKVKNSRFAAEAVYVSTPEEARELWKLRKQTCDNGGHIVYAFAVGPQQNICGCSDDGEPSGTAGKPVLAVLKGSGITNILITIARYFGGTKLGTGGLVHAYGDAAKAVLATAATKKLEAMTGFEIELAYPLRDTLLNRLAPIGFTVTGEEFGSTVKLSGDIIAARSSELEKLLQEVGNGRISWRRS